MCHIEEHIFDQYTGGTPGLYKRYIDDIARAISGSRDEIEDFCCFCEWLPSQPKVHLVHFWWAAVFFRPRFEANVWSDEQREGVLENRTYQTLIKFRKQFMISRTNCASYKSKDTVCLTCAFIELQASWQVWANVNSKFLNFRYSFQMVTIWTQSRDHLEFRWRNALFKNFPFKNCTV